MKYLFIFLIGIWAITFSSMFMFYDETVLELSSTQNRVNGFGLFLETKKERGDNLKWNECLQRVATERSEDMVNRDYFSHKDPETGDIETWDKIVASCGQYTVAGENLVKNYDNYVEAHSALMGSKLHRDNILNENYTVMGVGCYENICTELFGNF